MDAKGLLVASLIVIALAFHLFWYLTVRGQRRASAGTQTPLTPTPLAVVCSPTAA